jgi:hypothetical protein
MNKLFHASRQIKFNLKSISLASQRQYYDIEKIKPTKQLTKIQPGNHFCIKKLVVLIWIFFYLSLHKLKIFPLKRCEQWEIDNVSLHSCILVESLSAPVPLS